MKRIQSALILYPNQLFNPELFPQVDIVFLVEEPLFFGTDIEYPNLLHKQKLLLHKASMHWYVEEVLWPANINVEYIELKNVEHTAWPLIKAQEMGAEVVYVFDPTDHAIEARYNHALKNEIKSPFELRVEPNPSFMLRRSEVQEYFGAKTKHNFANFYQWQRERFDILIDKKYKPVGGKWSFDVENRKKLPIDHAALGFNGFGDNEYVTEAKKWVEKHFPDNPGSMDSFFWPTTYEEASEWLNDFIEHRLNEFGPYEDAMDGQGILLYHSGLSAPLNIGLLTPNQIVEAILKHHEKNPVPMPSLEGFIRQVIGWREYVRALYITQNVSMRTSNSLKQSRSLSADWWQASVGITPVDEVLKKILSNAYAHHIERLMIVGNIMMLCEIKPDEVYKWFMSLFIDAYDWVMVPNVYGMSQFSDLGSMVTKPYISGSNYILKMSHYEKGEWCDVWDGLFWNFIEKHKEMLSNNPRMSMMVKQLGKLDANKRRVVSYRAQDFLARIDN